MCVCVCVCVCVSVCVHVCFMGSHRRVYIYICVCTCNYLDADTYVKIVLHGFTRDCVCKYMQVHRMIHRCRYVYKQVNDTFVFQGFAHVYTCM